MTKVPHSPDFVRGVMNVRGSAIPVIDLRMKLDMPQAESTVNTRIIIMEITFERKSVMLGVIVDSVNDMLELKPNQIEAFPETGSQWRSEFIKG